jgi:hypothetical protein
MKQTGTLMTSAQDIPANAAAAWIEHGFSAGRVFA